MIKLDFKYLDEQKKLIKRIERKTKRCLFKTGGYVRSAMQRSMRYAGKTAKAKHSKPGEPPRAHRDTKRGPLLRKLIVFEVDEKNGTVIIGPKKTDSGFGGAPVPQVLDQGGISKLRRHAVAKTQFDVGDYGPVRYRGAGKFVRTLLESNEMCERAARLVNEENAVRAHQGVRIAARPFTSPRYTDGGKRLMELVEKEPL